MEFEFYDISPVISEQTPVFPGDVAFERTVFADMKNGDAYTLSSMNTTLHIGAHADAPSHYSVQGEDISQRNLIHYYGFCQVVEVQCDSGERIGVEDVDVKIRAPRVLFKTKSFCHDGFWSDSFNSLSPELVEFLCSHKVITVGIDTPSVDPADSKKLESHQCIAANNLAILEGLDLDAVPPGLYKLVALPLKIKNADASPVRAVLLSHSSAEV